MGNCSAAFGLSITPFRLHSDYQNSLWNFTVMQRGPEWLPNLIYWSSVTLLVHLCSPFLPGKAALQLPRYAFVNKRNRLGVSHSTTASARLPPAFLPRFLKANSIKWRNRKRVFGLVFRDENVTPWLSRHSKPASEQCAANSLTHSPRLSPR